MTQAYWVALIVVAIANVLAIALGTIHQNNKQRARKGQRRELDRI